MRLGRAFCVCANSGAANKIAPKKNRKATSLPILIRRVLPKFCSVVLPQGRVHRAIPEPNRETLHHFCETFKSF